MPPTESDGKSPHDLVPLPIERGSLDAQVLRDHLIARLVRVEILTLHDLSLKFRQLDTITPRSPPPDTEGCDDLCLALMEMDHQSYASRSENVPALRMNRAGINGGELAAYGGAAQLLLLGLKRLHGGLVGAIVIERPFDAPENVVRNLVAVAAICDMRPPQLGFPTPPQFLIPEALPIHDAADPRLGLSRRTTPRGGRRARANSLFQFPAQFVQLFLVKP